MRGLGKWQQERKKEKQLEEKRKDSTHLAPISK